MPLRRLHRLALIVACSPAFVFAAQKPCVTTDQASKLINKDVCVTAHVYEVVELPSGTRFLDVCTPGTPDEKCQFTIVSMREDRDEVGELSKVQRYEREYPRHRAAHARPRRDGVEPRAAILWWPTQIPAQSQARAGIRRRAEPPLGERSKPALTRRPPRIHEHPRPGDAPDKVRHRPISFSVWPPRPALFRLNQAAQTAA